MRERKGDVKRYEREGQNGGKVGKAWWKKEGRRKKGGQGSIQEEEEV